MGIIILIVLLWFIGFVKWLVDPLTFSLVEIIFFIILSVIMFNIVSACVKVIISKIREYKQEIKKLRREVSQIETRDIPNNKETSA